MMKKVEHAIVDIMQSYNSAASKSATLKANYVEKWHFISLERMITATKYHCYYCFTTAQQSAQYIVK